MDEHPVFAFARFAEFVNASNTYDRAIENILDPMKRGQSKVFEIIDDIVLNRGKDSFFQTIPEGTELFRARVMSPKDILRRNGIEVKNTEDGWISFGFNEANSIECPLGIGGAGRNNIPGVSYLYVADNPETACAEMKSNIGDLISVATMKTKKDLRVIDFYSDKKFEHYLTEEYSMSIDFFMERLMRQYYIPVSDPKEYMVSQIVSDYLRKTGVDGVSYRSNFTQGRNYTIFNSHRSNIVFVSSRIVFHQKRIDTFWDYNELKTLIAQNTQNDVTKEISDETMRQLMRTLKINESKSE